MRRLVAYGMKVDDRVMETASIHAIPRNFDGAVLPVNYGPINVSELAPGLILRSDCRPSPWSQLIQGPPEKARGSVRTGEAECINQPAADEILVRIPRVY